MLNINHSITQRELREFGLVTSGLFILFFGFLIPWIWDFQWPLWPWIVASTLSPLALVAPGALKPVYVVWIRFAEILGWINTRIILTLIFFLIFLPFGLVMRIFNDPMSRKLDEKIKTYRIQSRQPKNENMEKIY